MCRNHQEHQLCNLVRYGQYGYPPPVTNVEFRKRFNATESKDASGAKDDKHHGATSAWLDRIYAETIRVPDEPPEVPFPPMADHNTRFITVRRSTVVRVAIVVAVLTALGIGLAVGVSVGSHTSPPAKSAAATSTTVRGSTTTTTTAPTTTTPLPAVLSCGPRSTPHLLPPRPKVGCAAGSVTVTAITWKAWDAETGGQGTGTLNVQKADGTFSSTPAVVVVFGVVNGIFQDVSIVPTITLTTTTTTTITPTITPTTGPSPVIASQPGSGWGSD